MKKTAIVWDLDNTLYRETPELHALLDKLTAEAAIEDFHLPLDIETATKMVNESYKIYRDGGEIFIQKYGVSPKAMFDAYHKRKEANLEHIVPYEGLLSELKTLSLPQYVFSTSSRSACDALLRKLGLFEFFAGKFYSVEDFGCYKKNENEEVYLKFCAEIGHQPQACLFVDDSYSNLECAKKAGMNTIRLCHGKPNDKAVEYIDYSSDNIKETIALLQKLEKTK
ncbi:MAG: HAD family hydrolase [Alphaproteobacteria bacterium]|nr:HAD family hydrolase [Alphaproteobacteria bacterium]